MIPAATSLCIAIASPVPFNLSWNTWDGLNLAWKLTLSRFFTCIERALKLAQLHSESVKENTAICKWQTQAQTVCKQDAYRISWARIFDKLKYNHMIKYSCKIQKPLDWFFSFVAVSLHSESNRKFRQYAGQCYKTVFWSKGIILITEPPFVLAIFSAGCWARKSSFIKSG